jgi:5,10-methylenetetrahydromethanopterin reductase
MTSRLPRRVALLEQAGIDELLIQSVIDRPTEMAQLAELRT